MEKWNISMKPAEHAEYQLVEAILTGEFPVDSLLPGERELAELLGVTRPTLREVLQRMARDGWVEIQQGKPTRIKNFLVEGNLGVLSSISQHQEHIQPDFVANLLALRRLVAPDYTRLAVGNHPTHILEKLQESTTLSGHSAIALYDWQLHHLLAVCSHNPVFPLLLNGFSDLYQRVGLHYYSVAGAVDLSRDFYVRLKVAIERHDPYQASGICESVMIESEQLWHAYMTSEKIGEEAEVDVME